MSSSPGHPWLGQPRDGFSSKGWWQTLPASEHHEKQQNATHAGMARRGFVLEEASSVQFCTFWAPLCQEVSASLCLTQTRARGLAKQNPNLLTPHPSGTSLCVWCCCCCFINGFSASLMSCVCLPCPAGTREPTTSISDFSGEPRAGSSLGQRSLAQPLPAPSALTRPRVLRCRHACPRARHCPDHPRCPGEPGTWGLLQHFPPSPSRASVSPPAAAVARTLSTSLCCCSSLAGGQERSREPPCPGAD